MMKRFSGIIATLVIVGLFTVTQSFAANQQSGAMQQESTQTQQQPQMGQQGQRLQQQSQQASLQGFRGEELRGKSVKDQQGQELGSIEDVYIGGQGQTSYVLLEGEEENKLHPIPFQALQRGESEDEFRVNISKDQLAQAPSFEKDETPNLADREWQQRIHGYYDQAQQQGQQQMQGAMRAEDLKDKTVKDQQGEELGKIENVVVGEQGQTSYVLLEGQDDKIHPIPVQALQRGESEDEFRVNISKDQFAQSPSFQKGEMPDLTQQEWQQRIHGYYDQAQQQGQQPQRQPQTQQTQPQQQSQVQQQPRTGVAPQTQMGQQDQQTQQQPQKLALDEEVVGKSVVNQQGEDLGNVDEVIADAQGRIRYIILSHGGFLGVGAEKVPIPWQMVQQSPEEDALLVDISRERLDNAPRYRADERPDFQQPEWEQRVHGYYGLQPEQRQQ